MVQKLVVTYLNDIIPNMEPNTRFKFENETYVKMHDSSWNHIDDYIFCLDTGWYGHWSRIITEGDVITLD